MPRRAKSKDGKPAVALGEVLRQTRELIGISLRKAAESAEISPAYLSQLETGDVRDPSPRVLHGLAQVYAGPHQIPSENLYAIFMTRAGYVVPGDRVDFLTFGPSPLELALKGSTPLTPVEQRALTEYLAWFRSRNGRSVENTGDDRASGSVPENG